MTRYFFHVRRNGILTEDPHGIELGSRAAALAEAVQAAKDALHDSVLGGEPVEDVAFEVIDQDGNILIKLPFKSVERLQAQIRRIGP